LRREYSESTDRLELHEEKITALFSRFLVVAVIAAFGDRSYAREKTMAYVRWSELEIDRARLDRFAVPTRTPTKPTWKHRISKNFDPPRAKCWWIANSSKQFQ
jgi:hypothetical protein